MLCSLSNLSDKQLGEIRSLEKSLGVNLLAFSCYAPPIAELDRGKLEQLKSLEEKLGLTLVAVQ